MGPFSGTFTNMLTLSFVYSIFVNFLYCDKKMTNHTSNNVQNLTMWSLRCPHHIITHKHQWSHSLTFTQCNKSICKLIEAVLHNSTLQSSEQRTGQTFSTSPQIWERLGVLLKPTTWLKQDRPWFSVNLAFRQTPLLLFSCCSTTSAQDRSERAEA